MEWFDIKGYEGLYQINKNGEETLNNAILEGNSVVISPRDFGVYKSAFQKVEVE